VSPAAVGSLASDGRRVAIHPADVRGKWATRRKWVFAALLAIYVVLPWVSIGGHPAVFIDIPTRHFFLFGAAFNAQDLWLTALVLLIVGVSLLWTTALLGRAWCGWACPQTVFLEGVFRRVERWIQGPREKRMRGVAIWRKVVTHAIYAVLAVFLAHVFLSYFTSLPALFQMVRARPSEHLAAFSVVSGLSILMYLNFAWFREQTCVVVCPYGRLQSALIDAHSLVIGYDTRRGEPRGKVGKTGAGDCVDCKRCVAVCPTGIDIRNGLQLDCIACTACADACDEIMVKLKRPTGLIRYDSLDGLAGKPRRVIRPRVVAYTALLAGRVATAGFAFRAHAPFEAHVIRAPGLPYTRVGDDVANLVDLHVVNKAAAEATFTFTAVAPAGVSVALPPSLTLPPLSDTHASVRLALPARDFHGDFPVTIVVKSGEVTSAVDARFLGPPVTR
jgi:cytochrome c oxidase accessory protein FixG